MARNTWTSDASSHSAAQKHHHTSGSDYFLYCLVLWFKLHAQKRKCKHRALRLLAMSRHQCKTFSIVWVFVVYLNRYIKWEKVGEAVIRRFSLCKPPPIPKCETKVIRDLNLHSRINLDTDVCRICPKMLWMQYLVGISHSSSMVQIGCLVYEKC